MVLMGYPSRKTDVGVGSGDSARRVYGGGGRGVNPGRLYALDLLLTLFTSCPLHSGLSNLAATARDFLDLSWTVFEPGKRLIPLTPMLRLWSPERADSSQLKGCPGDPLRIIARF